MIITRMDIESIVVRPIDTFSSRSPLEENGAKRPKIASVV